MKFGVQLFGVLNGWEGTAEEAFGLLAELGFKRIEPCVAFCGMPAGMEKTFWPAEQAGARLRAAREAGLEAVSCHIAAEDLGQAAGRLKRFAEETGIRQFVVKTPHDMDDVSLHQAALGMMRAADALSEAGAELLLHNEEADIRTKICGVTAFERLLELCQDKAGAQVDIGWAQRGGEDPAALLRRLGARVRSIHYKDFAGTAETAVGSGDVPTVACFRFARAHGIPQLIDMDSFPGGRTEDLRASLNFLSRQTQVRDGSVSYLNVLDTETGEIRVLRRFDRVIEAPNWLKSRNAMLYNSEGRIWRYDLGTGEETMLESGACDNCNNDHVVSPDETRLAVSCSPKENGFFSRVYILPIDGGEPKLITPNAPSFLHGWSADGELAYCAFRRHEGKTEVDVYAIPEDGGEEKRLTNGGFNDGPEYAPDGKTIWFNSTRTGLMQVWRMNRDGSEQTQMTFTERNNWFGHVSPDGSKVAYISYGRDDLEAGEHLCDMRVEIWLMNADGSNAHRVASLFGGQGSMNVNSWAGDSRHLAFVSYDAPV